jgi:hypothetical protein
MTHGSQLLPGTFACEVQPVAVTQNILLPSSQCEASADVDQRMSTRMHQST